jgi:hypothetical protein
MHFDLAKFTAGAVALDPDGYEYTFGALLPDRVDAVNRMVILNCKNHPLTASIDGVIYTTGMRLTLKPIKKTLFIAVNRTPGICHLHYTSSAYPTKEACETAYRHSMIEVYQIVPIEIEVEP